MSTFPTSLDTLTMPGAGDNLNTTAVLHHLQHDSANSAIMALESKVGINNSTASNSLDYKASALSASASANLSGISALSVSASSFNSAISALSGSASAVFSGVSALNVSASSFSSAISALSASASANFSAVSSLKVRMTGVEYGLYSNASIDPGHQHSGTGGGGGGGSYSAVSGVYWRVITVYDPVTSATGGDFFIFNQSGLWSAVLPDSISDGRQIWFNIQDDEAVVALSAEYSNFLTDNYYPTANFSGVGTWSVIAGGSGTWVMMHLPYS